MTQIMDVSLY